MITTEVFEVFILNIMIQQGLTRSEKAQIGFSETLENRSSSPGTARH